MNKDKEFPRYQVVQKSVSIAVPFGKQLPKLNDVINLTPCGVSSDDAPELIEITAIKDVTVARNGVTQEISGVIMVVDYEVVDNEQHRRW